MLGIFDALFWATEPRVEEHEWDDPVQEALLSPTER
jgi:hypothetical protein